MRASWSPDSPTRSSSRASSAGRSGCSCWPPSCTASVARRRTCTSSSAPRTIATRAKRPAWCRASTERLRGTSPERLALASGERMERLLEPPGDRSRRAVADPTAVALRHRDHLGTRSGEEALVGSVDVEAREPRFAHAKASLPGEPEQRGARDSLERAVLGRRRRYRTVARDVEVVARALGDESLGVQHDRLVRAGPRRIDLREDVLEVIERLDARIDGLVRDLPRGGRDDTQALLVELGRVEPDVGHDDEDARPGTRARVEAEVAHAAGDDQADVAVLLAIGPDRRPHRL